MYQLGGYYEGGTGTNLWVRSEANHGRTSWTAWRRLLNTSSDPYAANMNQYVRTTDDVSFNTVGIPGSSNTPINITGAAHKYLTINPGNGYEAMVRYIGGSGSSWYVGKRTSGQLVGTQSFHFYSEAAAQTVAGIDTGGNIFSIGSMRSPVYYDSNDTAKYLQRNTSTYTSWFMGGANNGYSGWNVDGGMHLMIHTSGTGAPCGFYHQSLGWSALFYVNGTSALFHAANEKIITQSYGVYVTGEIRASSDITAYYSDIRLKKDIDVIPDAVEKIKQLRGVTYTWNDEEVNVVKNRSGQRDIGLIAQEVEAVEPLFTKEYQTPLDETPKDAEAAANFTPRMSETYKTIKYDKLVALLVEGMKEQQQQIEDLKQQINYLVDNK
jgi:hypothetical protein